MNFQPERVLDYNCLLGEGPLWDAKQNSICWVDILKGQIHQYHTITHKHSIISVGEMIGCICLCADGNFIAGLQNGIGIVDRESGKIKMLATPENRLPGNRFNDGRCDPAGRFWAGTMALSEEEGAGNLYMMDHDGNVSKKVESVTISNGLAWSKDKKTLYYIDTPTHKIVAFDFDMASGKISNKRAVIRIAKEEGSPDGMTIDSDDMLWIAHWGGWQVTRWNPQTGQQLDRIALPVSKVTSCTFGGDTLEDLYITTASVDLSEHEMKEQPLAGTLFVVHNCGFKGTSAFEYARVSAPNF